MSKDDQISEGMNQTKDKVQVFVSKFIGDHIHINKHDLNQTTSHHTTNHNSPTNSLGSDPSPPVSLKLTSTLNRRKITIGDKNYKFINSNSNYQYQQEKLNKTREDKFNSYDDSQTNELEGP